MREFSCLHGNGRYEDCDDAARASGKSNRCPCYGDDGHKNKIILPYYYHGNISIILINMIFYRSLISPAHLNAYFATITAIISLIIAAATMVPDTIDASDGSKEDRAVVAIPVNTKETPE